MQKTAQFDSRNNSNEGKGQKRRKETNANRHNTDTPNRPNFKAWK
ncbi:MAG: hypothetical protein P4L61_02865 [Candidatus Pacebacteria bacterium]|nr:hypothetical protein [Candidatus Paceibacterota bacterium]